MNDGAEYQEMVSDRDSDRTFSLRILPYRAIDGTINGATIVFTDISHAISIESQLAAEQDRHDLAIEASGIGVWEYVPGEHQFVFGGAAMTLLQTDDERPSLDSFLGKLSPR